MALDSLDEAVADQNDSLDAAAVTSAQAGDYGEGRGLNQEAARLDQRRRGDEPEMTSEAQRTAQGDIALKQSHPNDLTRREVEVLSLVSRGADKWRPRIARGR
jgi:DNA-binding NarL/FixJ family response regulator